MTPDGSGGNEGQVRPAGRSVKIQHVDGGGEV